MNKTRVLLADDHAVVRAGISKALGELNELEIVGEVGDGPTLFDALTHLCPDVLLVDVAMPGFSAVADVRRIRAGLPLRSKSWLSAPTTTMPTWSVCSMLA